MAGGAGAKSRLHTYRRRLAAAAVTSLALHLILARGLALTPLGLDGPRPEAGDAPSRPKRRSDFFIRVPKAPAARPAHERPLAIAAPQPTADPTPAERPTAAATPRSAAEPNERVTTRTAAAPAPARDATLAAAPTPDRAAPAALAPASARADTSEVSAATNAVADAMPAAVSRQAAAEPVVASQWRPREIALLERLAIPAPVRTARSRDDEAGPPAAAPAERSALVDDAGVAPAEPVAVPTGDASRPIVVAPAGRAPAAARSAHSGRNAGGRDAGPTAPATPGPDLRGIAAVRGRARGGETAEDAAIAASRSPGRAPPTAVAAGRGTGPGDTVAGAAGVGVAVEAGPGPALGPRAVGRAAELAAGRAAPAAAVPRRGDAEDPGGMEDEAQLSVSQPPAGFARVGPSRDDAEPAAGPRPPDRATVVALPAETRVRDVAEAFARRGREARRERRSDPRAARADAVVDRGLEFLVRAQQADGRWSLGRFAESQPADVPRLASDTAATGLALLAFLGAGHDHFDGPHRATVRRGLEFLLSVQKPDGDLYLPADDLSNSCGWLYSHGIASIALCEAVGMTGDPLLRPAATRACGFIAASRHPELGGWRYAPRADADLSVSGWMLVALRSGALAGLETDPQALAGVRTLLDAAALPGSPAGYAYNPLKPEQRTSEISGLCMTAVGGLMRLHTGAKPDDARVAAAARVLAARRPAWDARGRDAYLWYCASQVLVHTGGPAWDAWYAALVDTLAATQETAGPRAGSWNPLGPRPDRWGRQAGRIYVTALHLLALEVPDRRLPTYTARE